MRGGKGARNITGKATCCAVNLMNELLLKKMRKKFFFHRCHIKYFISLYLNLSRPKDTFLLNF